MLTVIKLFLSLAFLTAIYGEKETDYCHFKKCSRPERHIMCLYPYNDRSTACVNVTVTGIDDFQRRSLVDAFNAFRRYHKDDTPTTYYQDARWDNNLAEVAQRWANQCSGSLFVCNAIDDRTDVYQRTYVGPIVYPYAVLEFWHKNGVDIMNPKKPQHQFINRIGCGSVVADGVNYLSCNIAYISPVG